MAMTAAQGPSIGDITLVSTRSIDQSVEIKTLASILSDALELKVSTSTSMT